MMIPMFFIEGAPPELDGLETDEIKPIPVSKAAVERIKDMFKEFLQNGLTPI